MSILLGVIADDFTGATDVANTLVKAGMPTIQLIGNPVEEPELGNAKAVVIALKSRTAPVSNAVEQSLKALDWLLGKGARQILFKYCSTFDSTREGNIGPVADAIMDAMNEKISVICPAFPENGRSIYMGNLFVGDVLLSESSMKDHPLTPMTDSNLVRLMTSQSSKNVGLINHEAVARGSDAVRQTLNHFTDDGVSYAVLDAINNNDLLVLGKALAETRFITGGSGIAMGLPDNFRQSGQLGELRASKVPEKGKRSLILAGSCSVATLGQIAYAKKRDWPVRKLDAERCTDENYPDEIASWALDQSPDDPVLIYASSSPAEVKEVQSRFGSEVAGKLFEDVHSRLASTLTKEGFHNLITAGGETSGAVVSHLGITQLEICAEIQPGVPWTRAGENGQLALALKSGNFGTPDFFEEAIGMLQ